MLNQPERRSCNHKRIKLVRFPISSGISTITVNKRVPYAVGVGTEVPFHKQSRIIASSHSFEYIGTGVDPLNSLRFSLYIINDLAVLTWPCSIKTFSMWSWIDSISIISLLLI